MCAGSWCSFGQHSKQLHNKVQDMRQQFTQLVKVTGILIILNKSKIAIVMSKKKIGALGLIFLAFFNLECTNNNNHGISNIAHANDTSYQVYKIDSINSFYLIYALKGKERFKIITKKENESNCEDIQVDARYAFSLNSLTNDSLMPGVIDCIKLDSMTKICVEDSVYELCTVNNVKGLCFEKK
jgi:hypothetical protein